MAKFSEFKLYESIRDVPNEAYLVGYDPTVTDPNLRNFRVNVGSLKAALVPDGGTKGQFLVKTDDAPNRTGWRSVLATILGL